MNIYLAPIANRIMFQQDQGWLWSTGAGPFTTGETHYSTKVRKPTELNVQRLNVLILIKWLEWSIECKFNLYFSVVYENSSEISKF